MARKPEAPSLGQPLGRECFAQNRVLRETAVGPGTRPLKILGPFDETGPDRILLYIANRVPEVSFIEWTTLEALLPQVTGNAVFVVEVVCMKAVQVVHQIGKAAVRLGNGDVVDMVRNKRV